MAVKKEPKVAKPVAKSAKAAAPKAKKAAPKGKSAGEVEFKVFSPHSGSVAVAGDFNGWTPTKLKKDKDGNWSAKIKLGSGSHQYKFVFDGQYWETDKANPERISDGRGGENSIARV
jgi:1,4-alpha-glucan branching enzyme